MNRYQPPPKDPNEDYIVLVSLLLALFLSLPLWTLCGWLMIAFFKAFYPLMGGEMTRFMISASPFIFFGVVWLSLIVFIKGWVIPWWRLRMATRTIERTLQAEIQARTGQVAVKDAVKDKGKTNFNRWLLAVCWLILIGYVLAGAP